MRRMTSQLLKTPPLHEKVYNAYPATRRDKWQWSLPAIKAKRWIQVKKKKKTELVTKIWQCNFISVSSGVSCSLYVMCIYIIQKGFQKTFLLCKKNENEKSWMWTCTVPSQTDKPNIHKPQFSIDAKQQCHSYRLISVWRKWLGIRWSVDGDVHCVTLSYSIQIPPYTHV